MKTILLLSILAILSSCSSAPSIYEADVIVYGDTSGGVVAAVQSARHGKSVILVSQYGHLGGMTSSGISYIYRQSENVIPRLIAALSQVGLSLLQALRVAGQQGNPPTTLQIKQCQCPAYTAGAARDQCMGLFSVGHR